jgi:VWFA-related protein
MHIAGIFCLAAGITAGWGTVACAQAANAPNPVETLHISTTLLEIPLLILDQKGQVTERPPSADSIQIRLGDGGWFRPNYVRQEGQDPINLAIVLDQKSPVSDLPRPLTQALSSLSSLSLTSRDQVSLFVMDCSSVRVTNIPENQAQVDSALKSAIDPPEQSGARHTCKEGGRLWDTLAAVTRILRNAPSRRVILAITEGKDHSSVVTPQSLAELAQSSAVTIFELNPTDNSMFTSQQLRGLPLVAAASGGTGFGVEPGSLRSRIHFIVTLLRNRYIAQFHLPPDEKAGRAAIAARVATVPVGTYQIRLTGNSVPLPNPAGPGAAGSQVAQAEAAPAQPAAVVAPEPPPVGHPAAASSPEVANEAAPTAAGEPWVAKADAAVRTQPSPRDSSVPTLKVDTRLTLVDVTVTDSKGHPIHGLTAADFTVKEDGRPQPIKNFEEFGKDKPKTGSTSGPSLPPDVYSNQQSAQPQTQAVDILLFDQVSTGISRGLQPSPEAIKDAKEAATQYLKEIPAGTRTAVMTTDGSGLHLLQDFTTHRDLLIAAVNSITFHIIPDAHWEPAPGPPPCPTANFQSQQALNALNQTALFTSAIPGRKNLLFFTPGVPWLTDYPYFAGISCFLIDYTSQLQQVYGKLTAARVALYPIDARGLYNDPAEDASRGGRPVNNPIGFNSSVYEDEKTLDDFAKATGGKAHYGGIDLLGALRDDAATGADYYALSYVPPLSKYDGKYHKIEVTVDRPKVQLEYRRGYTSLDPKGATPEAAKDDSRSAAPKDAFHAAMSYGAPAATEVTFAVRALPAAGQQAPGVIGSLNPELKGKPLVRYSFDFDLPRDRITLTEQPDGSRQGSFELAIAAYDVQGRVLNSLDEKRSLTLKADTVSGFLQKPFVVPVEIDLPQGEASVRAGVLDLPSEQIGVVEIPLSVTK